MFGKWAIFTSKLSLDRNLKGFLDGLTLGATLKDETTDVQNANPAQNKKSCKPTHKPTQIAAHFILPNHTQAHPPPYK